MTNTELRMGINAPSGQDLLATLIELLADQENVKITYEFAGKRSITNGQT